ncbi:hypothetical protein CFC21_011174 [Triticum aestivum]|uniref:Exostosin GT47 domain-containing protein n=3 Tax=Triticinae TaxID=1648030 RepID=A0A452YC91_AEGTS|nr:xyloglucan galactosyltransferase KATAMARI1 homolog [Aegilops tauschii subsp. strangulata]XP_044441133.1 xyloglucan galactosyltransferase KATAMARI1 homolog [Triticum aestivum]KAF6994480.1 hypothetical protein CFC21_011174 [Triticum aestivum]
MMKRHNSAALPPSTGGEMHEETTGKADKSYKRPSRCSRLCSFLIIAAAFSMLACHCYDYAHGGVARVEHGPASSRRRGGSPFSDPAVPPRRDTGDRKVSADNEARELAAADARRRRELCTGQYIYVQELPSRFNTDMVWDCEDLSPSKGMCKYTANGGFGPRLRGGDGGVLQETGWYDSDELALDVIFHDRIKRYECLTNDSSLASAVYVPFYAGLDVARHLWGHNVSTRDAMALEMVDLVTARPEWRALGGRDHFFVAGRTTWDFRRQGDVDTEWGNKLFRLPAVRNMTAIVVEASPWDRNDAAIPYPTAFHPATDEATFFWQDRVRGLERQWLFSFAGAHAEDSKSIASNLVEQCRASAACSLMECTKGPSNQCDSPASVMKLFQSSTFCLQPRGDRYTRRLAFDAVLAGCIPVFFHPGTAYVQYTWHLPKNHTDYSVYISEEDVRRNVSVEERLRRIPPEAVERMRGAVVGLIPAVTYSDTSTKLESTVNDAFDLALWGVIRKVAKMRKRIAEGRAEDEKPEMYSWKYPLLGEGQKAEDPHEWDPLFAFN